MDTSHVALVSLNLSMEGFETYRCEDSTVLGLNIANLSKVMKLADNSDSITLQADTDASHLKIKFENPKSGKSTEFQLNLLSLDQEHLSIPETEFGSVITVNSGEWSKMCKDLSSLSEALTIQTKDGKALLEVDGQCGKGQITLSTNEDMERKEDNTTVEVESPVTQQFALNYLNMFNKASGLSAQTKLCMTEDQPLVTQFDIEQLGVLKYYLAPKISDE